jgi:hypothetical protein
MITKKEIDLMLSHKDFLFGILVQAFKDPRFYLHRYELKELKEYQYLLEKNFLELYKIYKIIYSLLPLLGYEQGKNRKNLNNRQKHLDKDLYFFKLLLEERHKNIKSPFQKFDQTLNFSSDLNNIDFFNFRELIHLIHNLTFKLEKEQSYKYFQSLDYIESAFHYVDGLNLNYRKNKMNPEIIYRKNGSLNYKETKLNYSSSIDKTIQLGIKSSAQNFLRKKPFDINDYYIAAKFSKAQRWESGDILSKLSATKFFGFKNKDSQKPEFLKAMEDLKFNYLRKKPSVTASIALIKATDLNKFYDYPRSELINLFNKININHVFFIDQDYTGSFFIKKLPLFEELNNSTQIFSMDALYIYYFSLEDFFLLYSTLIHVSFNKSYKEKKFSPDEIIELTKDYKISSDSLNRFFFNLINLKKSVFLFKNSSWSQIRKKFDNHNIAITKNNGDLLDSSDFSLSLFLFFFCKDGYKQTNLSRHSIPKWYTSRKFTKSEVIDYNKNDLGNIILNYIKNEEIILNELFTKDLCKDSNISYNQELKFDLIFFLLNNFLVKPYEISNNQELKEQVKNFISDKSQSLIKVSLNNTNKEFNEKELNILKLAKLINTNTADNPLQLKR